MTPDAVQVLEGMGVLRVWLPPPGARTHSGRTQSDLGRSQLLMQQVYSKEPRLRLRNVHCVQRELASQAAWQDNGSELLVPKSAKSPAIACVCV